MDLVSKIILFVAGTSYIVVGGYLLRTAFRNRGGPAIHLALAFVFNGISYACSELPFVLGGTFYVVELTFASRIFAGACATGVALFTLATFRSGVGWARRLVAGDAALILAGLSISAIEGDWEGLAPLTYKGFWLDWAGGMTPFAWLAIESSRQYFAARRRTRLGLLDPMVRNRYLLIGTYAGIAAATYLIFIPMYIRYELDGKWSPTMDLILGLAEIVSVAALTIAFTAPAFYRRWVVRSHRRSIDSAAESRIG